MKVISFSIFLFIFTFTACKKSETPTENEVPAPTGTTKDYTINTTNATSVNDNITGLTFEFPKGGNGKLTISEISDAPALEISAKKFTVNYTGNTQIQLSVPNSQTENGILFYYGSMTKASINGKDNAIGWWQVPNYVQVGDKLIYELTLQKAVGKTSKENAVPQNTYAFSLINSKSPEAEKMSAIKTSVAQMIDTWINSMPPDLANSFISKMNGAYKYNINFSGFLGMTLGGSSYLATNSLITRNCNFYFKLSTVETRTIAHEVGHYITHVLLGYDKYMEIYSKFPSNFLGSQISHSPGDNIGRSSGTIEDYAYFSEYLITGGVDLGYDFSSVNKINNFADVTNNSSPKNIDYPGSEGFSAAMLISLLRKSSQIYCFDKAWGQSTVPVVNATIQDVVSILAKGPRDVNETRTFIQNYLDSKGYAYKFNLSPMMEPLGWSYNVKGKIVDDTGTPISGASAQVVYQDYNREYRTFSSPKTGSDGEFVLPRVFPGTSILKIYANQDSILNAITVDWNKPTNTQIDLGSFTIAKKQSLNIGSYTLKISPAETSTGNIKIQYVGQKIIATRTSGTITHTVEIGFLNPPAGNIEIAEGKTFTTQSFTFSFKKSSTGGNVSFDGCEININSIDPTSGWFNDWQNSNLQTLGFTAPSIQKFLPATIGQSSASVVLDQEVKMSLTNTGGPAQNIDGELIFSGSIRNFWSSGDNFQFSLTFTYKN